jgi:cytochrome c556
MRYAKCYTRIFVSVIILLVGMTCVAQAAEKMASKEESIVKYRQAVMKSQAGHMGAAFAIITGKVDFKDQLADHVNALASTTKHIVSLFPKGTDVDKTKARKEVWTKNDEFRKHAKDAEEKADTLAKAVAAGDTQSYGKDFKALGEACKACHKDFRKKEKK